MQLIGLVLGLLALLGAGAMSAFPSQQWIGLSAIVLSLVGFGWIACHHFEIGAKKKIPFTGMILCAVGAIGFGVWYFLPTSSPNLIPTPFKRLIAYGRPDLGTQWTGGVLTLNGYYIGINNVGADTITSRAMFIRGYFDNTSVMWDGIPGKPQILPQTMGYIISTNRGDPTIVTNEVKDIIIEFEIDYDTIPENWNQKML